MISSLSWRFFLIFSTMKKSFYISLLLLSGVTAQVQAQNDTLWIGYNDEVVDKTLAQYYKFIVPKNDHTFEVSQYTLKNILHSKGFSSTNETPSLYQGKLQLFDVKGNPMTTTTYKDGLLVGPTITTLADGSTFTATYKDNEVFDGVEVAAFHDVFISTHANQGKLVSMQLFAIAPNKSRQIMYFENDKIVKEETYDKTGQLIASCTLVDYDFTEGKHVDFYYEPYQIKSISEHKNGIQIKKSTYFRTGEIKEIETAVDTNKTHTYYDRSGKVIAVYTEKTDNDGYSAYNDGSYIAYRSDAGKEDFIESINIYTDNRAVEFHEYDTDGIIKKITVYNKNYYPEKVTNFDKKGNIESELRYNEDGIAVNGTEKQENVTRVYSNSNLVSETITYSNGNPFKKYADHKATYFDKQGKQIGQATFNAKEPYYYYSTPVDGILITIDDSDVITDSNTYKNGKLINATTFENNKGKAVKSQEINYDDNENKISEIQFHPNGQILSDNRYTNYEITHSSYFDAQGKLLGKFDYTQMDGTLYTFFYSTNEVQSISRYSKGNLLYKKTYYKADIIFAENSKTYLESEIDFSKEGLFYDKGELVSKTTYKDGKPFEGKTIVRDEYSSKIVTNYENGEKEGEEVTYSIYLDDITTRDFYHLGKQLFTEKYENNIVVSRIPMENGIYHGEAIYFDPEGQEISRLTYNDGEPYEGVLIVDFGSESYETSTYKDGVVVESKTASEGQVRLVRTLLNKEELLYHVQNFNADGVLRYDFKMRDENLDGEVIFYNEKGKIQNKAEVKNGRLISGTISLAVHDGNYETSNHILVTKKAQKYTTKVFSDENKTLLYESTIKIIDKGESTNPLPINLPITRESLYPPLVEFDGYYYKTY